MVARQNCCVPYATDAPSLSKVPPSSSCGTTDNEVADSVTEFAAAYCCSKLAAAAVAPRYSTCRDDVPIRARGIVTENCGESPSTSNDVLYRFTLMACCRFAAKASKR